jgi:hypothetical protein
MLPTLYLYVTKVDYQYFWQWWCGGSYPTKEGTKEGREREGGI